MTYETFPRKFHILNILFNVKPYDWISYIGDKILRKNNKYKQNIVYNIIKQTGDRLMCIVFQIYHLN